MAATTSSGFCPLFMPQTFLTVIFCCPSAASSMVYSLRLLSSLMMVSLTSTNVIAKSLAARVSPIKPLPILPAPK